MSSNFFKMEEVKADIMGDSLTLMAVPSSFIEGMFMKYKGLWYYVGDLTKNDI